MDAATERFRSTFAYEKLTLQSKSDGPKKYMPVMKTITKFALSIIAGALTDVAGAGGFTECSEVSASDLGMRKLVPEEVGDSDSGKGWIVTCRITEAGKTTVWRSCAYFKAEFAKEAFMLLIDPRVFGSDFNGSVVRFVGSVYRLPNFRPGPESRRIVGNDKMATKIGDEGAGDTRVYYMVETVEHSELLALSEEERKAVPPNGELKMFPLKKPREVIPLFGSKESQKFGAAKDHNVGDRSMRFAQLDNITIAYSSSGGSCILDYGLDRENMVKYLVVTKGLKQAALVISTTIPDKGPEQMDAKIELAGKTFTPPDLDNNFLYCDETGIRRFHFDGLSERQFKDNLKKLHNVSMAAFQELTHFQ